MRTARKPKKVVPPVKVAVQVVRTKPNPETSRLWDDVLRNLSAKLLSD